MYVIASLPNCVLEWKINKYTIQYNTYRVQYLQSIGESTGTGRVNNIRRVRVMLGGGIGPLRDPKRY